MEKSISQEERIRRAEEIYNRRKYENRDKYYQTAPRTRIEDRTTTRAKKKIIRKMIIQILVCTIIYLLIYTLQHSNQIFSENIMNKTKEILSYDISFQNLYNNSLKYLNSLQANINQALNNNLEHNTENNEDTANTEQTENSENNEGETNGENIESTENSIESGENINAEAISDDNAQITSNDQEAIGGAEVETAEVEKTQEELDIEYVKQNANIIWPLNGVITSRFGPRTPTEIVSANHCGLDIAGNIGTDIVAAMDGTVTLSSSWGDYGKHLKIESGEITTLYAHCSELLVEEGDTISQGQIIAKVGETGRATGPHLHFEIRREDRFINPEKILETL